MSRTTDTERGAWMAFDVAVVRATQPDLFGDVLPPQFWRDIQLAAMETLDECEALRAALVAQIEPDSAISDPYCRQGWEDAA